MKNKFIFLTGCVLAVSISLGQQAQAETIIWGLSNIHKINNKSSKPFTVYTGTYANYKNAQKMVSQLKSKGYSAKIKRNNKFYIVYIGPFNSPQTLYSLASNTSTIPTAIQVKQNNSAYKNKPVNHQSIWSRLAPRSRQTSKDHTRSDTVVTTKKRNHHAYIGRTRGDTVASTKMGPIGSTPSWTWLASFSAGPVWTTGGSTQTFYLASDIEKTYSASKSSNAVFDGEFFLGIQKPLNPTVQGQLGLVVAATSNAILSGHIWDDADPQFDNYKYNYQVQHTHVAVQGKLLADAGYWLVPWLSASLGVGFNYAHAFGSTPTLFEAVPTPNFSPNTVTAFTYTIGLGVQKALTDHWQVGLGYEFADWGKNNLERAEEQTFNTGLALNDLYTNGFLLNVTYIG